jgi:hypothetical protein
MKSVHEHERKHKHKLVHQHKQIKKIFQPMKEEQRDPQRKQLSHLYQHEKENKHKADANRT